MARNHSSKLALAIALAAAVLIMPSRASAQADDSEASYLPDASNDPYLAGYDDAVADADADADADLARGWDRGNRRFRAAPRRYGWNDWRFRARPYRYYRNYDPDDYFYGRPLRYRYRPYYDRGYDRNRNFFFGVPFSSYEDNEDTAYEDNEDAASADELLADWDYGYGYGRTWAPPVQPYRYDREDYMYGRPGYYNDYYGGRRFDRDYDWRWRNRGEGLREFGRGFEPQERNRAFGREREETFGRPRQNEGIGRERGEGGRGLEKRGFERGGANRGMQRQGAVVPRINDIGYQQAPEGLYASEEDIYTDPDAAASGPTEQQSGASENTNWKDQAWESDSRDTTEQPINRY
ncbi:MAG: hypothetical protein NTZ09_01335 [Candidatus Hydrogenedentes bacterium]|nr:hypothetical protein [Candidatus Hydrogenedentota bacterium]